MRIMTWNSQGYKFGDGIIGRLLNRYDVDVLCLQECGDLSRLANMATTDPCLRQGIYSTGTSRNGKTYQLIYYPWRGNSRCSMAILVKEDYIVLETACIEPIVAVERDSLRYVRKEETEESDDQRIGLRGMLHVDVMRVDSDVFRVVNVHLPSGNPSFARKVGYHFLNRNTICGNSFMCGDFNTVPKSWELKPSYALLSPRDNTHNSGHVLDYMITSNPGQVIDVEVVEAPSSDHFPVLFFLNSPSSI